MWLTKAAATSLAVRNHQIHTHTRICMYIYIDVHMYIYVCIYDGFSCVYITCVYILHTYMRIHVYMYTYMCT